MREVVLKNCESFAEFPDGLLLVKENCNLMYLKKSSEIYIVREFINSIAADTSSVEYIISYYNVKDNKKVLTLKIVRMLLEDDIIFTDKEKDIDIIPLDKLLNIETNEKVYLNEEEICNIINFGIEVSLEKKHTLNRITKK